MVDDLRYPALLVTPNASDYQRRPGGGGTPRTFADIGETQERIRNSCEEIKADLKKSGRGEQTIGIARLKLRDEALAKSHRPVEAFTIDTCPVIGDLDETGELLVLVSPIRLDRLSRKISSLSQTGSAHLTGIESFALVGRERRFPLRVQSAVLDRIAHRGEARLKVRMPSFHIFTSLFREELEEQKLALTKLGVQEEPYLHQGDFEVYAVQVHNMEEAMSLASLSFVDRLDLMPIYVSTGSSAVINTAGLRLKMNRPIHELPIIAIVDTGIDPNSPLEPLVYDREMRVLQRYYNPSHGTSVAALAVASDGIVGNTLSPRCRLLDVVVVPNSDPDAGDTDELYEDTLIRKLEEALEKHSSVAKYWNLSLSTTPGPRLTAFSDLAIALDDFHKKFGVMFICAAGNSPVYRKQWPPDPNSPTERWVASPGDTVCGITVGSCAGDNTPDDALAPKGAPSPFSPRGPVAYSVIKPDIVEVGGNIASDGLTDIGVSTIQRDGEPCFICGTSFATPRVCGASAEINTCVEGSGLQYTNSHLITKALVLHHAKIPDTFAIGSNIRASDYYGYGRPSSLQDTIGDHFWRSTTLIYGRLYPNGEDLLIEDFPYADGLCSDKRSWGQIWITMVSEPILDPSFKTEYVRSNVDVHFGTVYRGKFRGQVRGTYAREGDEISLIREEHKWSPIKQYRSPSRMNCLGNRWQLRISLTLRDKESGLLQAGTSQVEDYPVDVVVAVTIADPLQFVPVNNQVFQKWRIRGHTSLSSILWK
jgi:serine protease AprX